MFEKIDQLYGESQSLSFTFDVLSQIMVSFLGLLAIILVAKKNRWGFVCGLASQPFWIITTIIHHQWGILVLCFAYTVTWSYGIYEWFLQERPRQPE